MKGDSLKPLNIIGAIVAIVAGLVVIWGAVNGWVVLPAEVKRQAEEISELKAQRSADHDILVEVRADVKMIKQTLKIQTANASDLPDWFLRKSLDDSAAIYGLRRERNHETTHRME